MDIWGRLTETPETICLATGNDGALDPKLLYHELIRRNDGDFPAGQKIKLGYIRDNACREFFNACVRGLYFCGSEEFVLVDVETPDNISKTPVTYLLEKECFINGLEKNREKLGFGGFDPHNGPCYAYYAKDRTFCKFGS